MKKISIIAGLCLLGCILTTKNANAIAIQNLVGADISFAFQQTSGGAWSIYRNMPTGSLSVPQTLMATNTSRREQRLYALGITFNPNAGSAAYSYNRYRFGITLTQTDASQMQQMLGKYEVHMEGVTNTGRNVRTTDCGYEFTGTYISHICYFSMEQAEFLTRATWSLGNHSFILGDWQDGDDAPIGYIIRAIGNSEIVLSDMTMLIDQSNDPLLSGQQELINNTNIINSNIVDIKNYLEGQEAQYEEQQSEISNGANGAGEEATTATSNLIETTTSIITVIRDTPATNCNIRVQRGAFDTGEINLCNVPSTIRTLISSVIVIPVTLAALHIAYELVIFYLYTVRKEQE